MTRVRTSLALSFLEKYSSFAIQLLASVVIARLVSPEAFGVFAVAYSIVGFAHVIREMGVNNYLVRHPNLRPRDIRAALFATGIVAWGLGAALFAALPLVGWSYGEPVRATTAVLLLSFLVMPISSTIFAILQREMEFGALLWINIAGAIANAGCAVGLTFAGWGALGLAWASVAGQVASTLVAIAYRPHRDHFLPSPSGAADVFRFGSLVMLSSVLGQFSTNAANLITAKFVSFDDMGQFGRAQSVTGLFSRLIMEAVQPLVLPVLSSLRRSGTDLALPCLQAFAYLTGVTWPFFAFVAVYADPIVLALFGEHWDPAAGLLRLMAAGGIFWVVQPIASPLLIAIDRARDTLRAQVVNQVLSVLAVLVAAPQGITAVAGVAILVSAGHAATWLYFLRAVVRLSARALAAVAARSAAATAIALALPVVFLAFGPPLSPLPRVMLGGTGLGLAWLAGVLLTRHPIAVELLHLAQGAKGAVLRRWARGGTGEDTRLRPSHAAGRISSK